MASKSLYPYIGCSYIFALLTNKFSSVSYRFSSRCHRLTLPSYGLRSSYNRTTSRSEEEVGVHLYSIDGSKWWDFEGVNIGSKNLMAANSSESCSRARDWAPTGLSIVS